MKKLLVMAAFAGVVAFFASAQTFTWLPTAASTQDAPYKWTDSANWAEFKDAGTGYPQGADVVVEMKGDFFAGTVAQYVEFPEEGLTLGELKFATAKASMHFVGGKLTLAKPSSSLTGSWATSMYPYFHCDVEALGDLTHSQQYRSKICAGFSVAGVVYQTYSAEMRACDRADLTAGNTYRDLYPRKWVTQGNDAVIELYGGNYQIYQTFDVITNKNGNSCKLQPQPNTDNATLEGTTGSMVWYDVKKLVGSRNVQVTMDGNYGNRAGTVRFYDLSEFTAGIEALGAGRIWLCRSDAGTDPYLKSLAAKQVADTHNSHVFRFCVPEADEVATVGTFVGCDHSSASSQSQVVKWGPGTLKILDYQPNCARGLLHIHSGTLAVSNATGVIDQPFLEMQDGTVLEIAAGVTLRVASAAFHGTVTVKGSGKLEVVAYSAVPDKIILADGAEVPIRPTEDDAVNAQVVPEVRGNPALWLDASDLAKGMDDIRGQVSSSGRVYRWNDTRTVTGDEGYMFVTNFNPGTDQAPLLELNVARNGGARVALSRNYSATSFVTTQALCWDRPLTNITSVFMMHDPVKGGGQVFGTTPRLVEIGAITGGGASSPWNRGHWDSNDRPNLLNSRVVTWAHIYDAEWRLNGERIANPSAEGLDFTDGTQLLEFHPAGGLIPADAFGCDASTTGNGQSCYSEVLIYTNAVSELDRRCIAAYLTKKWLEKAYVRTDDVSGCPAALAGSGSVELAAGDSVVLPRTDEGTELTLAGAGELTVSVLKARSFDVKGGSLVIVNNAITDESQLPDGLAYHIDATRAETTFDIHHTTDGTNFYGRLRDVRANAPYEARSRSSALTNMPFLRENALNGLSVLDFGPLGPSAPYTGKEYLRTLLQIMKAPTTSYGSDTAAQAIPNATATYQIFGSERGGNTIFGGPTIGSDAIASRETGNPTGYVAANGSTMGAKGYFSLNGREYKQSQQAFLSGAFDLVAWRQKGTEASSVDIAALAFSAHAAEKSGGQLLGEVLVYTNVVSEADHRRIQSYLNNKWFGSYFADSEPAALSALRVEKDAAAKVDGSTLALGTVGGGGTLTEGDFTLADGGVIELQVLADGSVAPLHVAADAQLTVLGGGTVRLVGDVEKIDAARSALVTGNVVFADPTAAWTVETAVRNRTLDVNVVDGVPVFSCLKSGLLLIVR